MTKKTGRASSAVRVTGWFNLLGSFTVNESRELNSPGSFTMNESRELNLPGSVHGERKS
jgi:hypothetical protein